MLHRISLLVILAICLESPAQTLIKDIYASTGNSSPFFMGNVNGKILFAASTPEQGRELWVTDGTTAGTKILKDLIPGVSGGMMFNAYFVSDTLVFFFAKQNSTSNPVSLFATNGTSAGTVWLCDITESAPPIFSGINGKLIFSFRLPGGRELWVSDGTPIGTRRLKDINTSSNGAEPFNLTPCKNQMFFMADDNEHGQELWVTDGTEAGTRLVKDIFAGIVSSTFTTSTPPGMIAFNDKVYFCAIQDLKIGYELFVSDGTDSGTKMVKDIYPGDYHHSTPYVIAACDQFLLMYATNSSGQNSLWRSDGTESGTFSILDDSSDNLIKNTAGKYLNLGDNLIFQFATKQFGSELWTSDGTTSGTKILIDVTPGIGSGVDGTMFKYGNQFIFPASNPLFGKELWISDATQDNTTIFLDLFPGTTGSGLNSILLVKSTLYCTLFLNSDIGFELYKIDLDGLSTNISVQPAYVQSIFPNPCKSGQTLYFPKQYQFLGLLDALGRPVNISEWTDERILIPESLGAGCYILMLSDGNSVKKKKIVVLN